MKAFTKAVLMRLLVLLHFIIMLGLFLVCWSLFYSKLVNYGKIDTHSLAVCAVYGCTLITLSRVYQAYNVGLVRVGEILYNQILANLVSLGLTYILACVLATKLLNPLPGFGVAIIQALCSGAWALLANKLYFRLNKPKNTIVIYRNESDLHKLEEIRFFEQRWNIAKTIHLDSDEMQSNEKPSIHKVIQLLKDYEVVFLSGVDATLRNGIIKYCVEAHKQCFFVPHTGDVITAGAGHVRSFSVPICRVRRCTPPPEFLIAKRLFDIIISLAAIIIFSPLMLATAIAIKCYDHGPVLYKQVRLTKDGKRFQILKFRSMRPDAEKDGVARLSTANDDRITPFGKFIRTVRVDELPQLFNILAGDMSIVGPRPERPEIAEHYMQELPAFSLRLQVKAGLTGYAQVYGRYNTEPQDKLKMDLMYINNIGFLEDLRLIFATLKILFMKESTSGVAEGQMTAAKEVDKPA